MGAFIVWSKAIAETSKTPTEAVESMLSLIEQCYYLIPIEEEINHNNDIASGLVEKFNG